MTNDTVLSPPSCEEDDPITVVPEKYLIIDNCLSEYANNESYKERVRTNLDIPSYNETEQLDRQLSELSGKLKQLQQNLSNIDDPYITQSLLESLLKEIGYVKQDGSVPFTKPQKGVKPKSSNDLVTLEYLIEKINEHSTKEDAHNMLQLVEELLSSKGYVSCKDVYLKNKTYSKSQIDDIISEYIKTDGSTPFTKPQIGQYPKFDSHLTTKRYVDESIYKHEQDVDPHGYMQLLNNKLMSYAKLKNVYDKTETYSRTQLDSIIEDLVRISVDSEIKDHINNNDPHSILEKIKKLGYVKNDGSVPFTSPQKGIEAEYEDELVTLGQLLEYVNNINNQLSKYEPIWKTSGPVETTVGFVEDNSEVSNEMTLQEIMDAIFYGKSVSITAGEFQAIGTKSDLLLCIHGSLGGIVNIELFQNGELIGVFDKEQFNDGCITVQSNPIYEDSEFEFRVTYIDGVVHNDFANVKVAYPVFVGLLPFIYFSANITWEFLEDLVRTTSDTENKFLYDIGNTVEHIKFNYQFEDAQLRKPFIVIPDSYPDLDSLTTTCQNFGIEAFQTPVRLPIQINDSIVYYKVYVYDQPLVKLNQEVIFNFKQLEAN